MIRTATDVFSKKSAAAKGGLNYACAAICTLLLPVGAHAQSAGAEIAKSSGEVASAAGFISVDLPTLIGRIIYAFLGLLGIIAVVLILYGGFLWMTAQGSEEKIKKAKQVLTNAVIGLIIIFSAFSIVYMILSLFDETGSGGFGGNNSAATALGSFYGSGGRGTALGNGILEYHYPEAGQTDVPRNTRISATFKKPLVLSSVFRNYDDKGTYTVSDDILCATAAPCESGTAVIPGQTALILNTNNIKIISNAALGSAGGGTDDEKFDNRYPDAASLTDPAPFASVTPTGAVFVAPQSQTVVIRPAAPIGSPTTNVNYRVAFRGGESGVRVWAESASGEPEVEAAFDTMSSEGAYYWQFETNTTIDTVPPRITDVIPSTTPSPGEPVSSILDRNQLLQIYFSEAVDPTTASGKLGTGGGFNMLEVRATCISDLPCDASYSSGAIVPGTFVLGNRYRTAEFTPDAACEGITENSCGETVYCLPRNVTLEVIAKAATIDNTDPPTTEPPASVVGNGVVDMTGNSLDGNRDGAAQGGLGPVTPQPGGRSAMYYVNEPQSNLAAVSDTANWKFVVGSNVDLTVPILRDIDPPPLPDATALHPDGPSVVPVDLPISMIWSKVISVTSMRSGSFEETTGVYKDPYSTLVLRSYECAKTKDAACTATSCPCERMAAPGFFLSSELLDDSSGSGRKVSRTSFLHPVTPFLTANDLGYTVEDTQIYPAIVPAYLPVARARLKDDKQNCFWPSQFIPGDSDGTDCALGDGQKSCCNRKAEADGTFLSSCAPVPATANQ